MKIEQLINEDFKHVVKLTKIIQSDHFADDRLCVWSSTLMREKLSESRSKGRHGWYDDKVCSLDDLKGMLTKAVDKGDMVDVMNFAAMIKIRECAED